MEMPLAEIILVSVIAGCPRIRKAFEDNLMQNRRFGIACAFRRCHGGGTGMVMRHPPAIILADKDVCGDQNCAADAAQTLIAGNEGGMAH